MEAGSAALLLGLIENQTQDSVSTGDM